METQWQSLIQREVEKREINLENQSQYNFAFFYATRACALLPLTFTFPTLSLALTT